MFSNKTTVRLTYFVISETENGTKYGTFNKKSWDLKNNFNRKYNAQPG